MDFELRAFDETFKCKVCKKKIKTGGKFIKCPYCGAINHIKIKKKNGKIKKIKICNNP